MTTDLWSDPNRDSYMAVTAHFMARDGRGQLILKTLLIAFRLINGMHTGANIGKELIHILDELQILHKVCPMFELYFTLLNHNRWDSSF